MWAEEGCVWEGQLVSRPPEALLYSSSKWQWQFLAFLACACDFRKRWSETLWADVEVIFKGRNIHYLLEDLVRVCLNICVVQGKEVGKSLWKRSLFSVKCDLVLPFVFYFILLAVLLFLFLLNQKQLLGSYCRSTSKCLCKALGFFACLIHAEKQCSLQEAQLISRNHSALVKLISRE